MTGFLSSDRPIAGLRPDAAVRLALIVSVLLVFWPVTDHGFINLDDPDYITENRHVNTGMTPENLRWAFTAFHSGNWHPVTWLSHMLDVEIFGMQAGGHHLMGLFLHLANTLLVFTVFARMTRNDGSSAMVAALFAFHPLHVEAVAWAAERKEVLSAFFGLLAIWRYAVWVRRPSGARYLSVLMLFSLGLMAKPMVITLPFVLLLLDVWPLERLRPPPWDTVFRSGAGIRLIVEKWPFFMLSGASGVVTFLAQQQAGAIGPMGLDTVGQRFGNAAVSYVTYLVKAIWPTRLAVFYPHPGVLPGWQVIGACALLASASYLIFRAAKRRPYLLMGWLWYLGTLVPVIGLVQIGAQAMADRYTYMPLIGIFIMATWGAAERTAGSFRKSRVNRLIAAAVVMALVPAARMQLALWSDDITLYTHTLSVTGPNPVIANNLGLAYADAGQNDRAIGLFRRALAIDPTYYSAHNNLGRALVREQRLEAAMDHYREALRINPGYALAHYNMGVALEKQGRADDAQRAYAAALAAAPDMKEAHNNLGNILLKKGRPRDAANHYLRAIAIDPAFARAHYNMGVALENLGRVKAAVVCYREALRIDPELTRGHARLGTALLRLGRPAAAIGHLEAAVRLDPHNAALEKMLAAARSMAATPKDSQVPPAGSGVFP